MNQKLPFQLDKTKTFYEVLADWVGDVFYDILPEHGFDVRDEQIYMAFQLEKAFKENKVIFAEAGVGTGKTLVYLLYAICYARYTGKPALIACADDLLIEQLMKDKGDIEKLSTALDLEVDVRLAKAQDNYLCLQKLDKVRGNPDRHGSQVFAGVYQKLPAFVKEKNTLQQFSAYGDRKEYPELSDEEWSEINWDTFQDCTQCSKRQRCGLTLHRDFYRKSQDLILCSHDYYMEHVWTKDSRVREGQLPLLPDVSCLVFDEGHLLEDAAQKALSYHLKHRTLERILQSFEHHDLRESFLLLVEDVYEANDLFFEELGRQMIEVEGSDRYEVNRSAGLQRATDQLYAKVQMLGEELVIESERHFIQVYDQRALEESLDSVELSLRLLIQDRDAITWVKREEGKEEPVLFIMPRTVAAVLQEFVFAKSLPVIFSSATLSVGGSFEYVASSLGIKDYISFSTPSPFDYESRMKIFMPSDDFFGENSMKKNVNYEKTQWIKERLLQTGGRTLVLFPSAKEQDEFEQLNQDNDYPFPLLYEGKSERSHMVQLFQEEPSAVLCASRLWEGLDVPGESLSHIIIWELPYPPNDPVFQSKRKGKADPYLEVDLPAMLLRMKQGVGRLIRHKEDKGTVTILSQKLLSDDRTAEHVIQILPPHAPIAEAEKI
ncbi:ATP-dependent DNA helicase DinG [Bacillus horti]|uniref:ATP-dependent DNA helicase DinG n=2 Tax=Caldalkalibacillus horti TaxID=77523 RepID=A0ABT9W328_9BACI|nr:ATP-dependent DNA helicase [Bacillus horti]MDQ0167525.1 ATP-dependent DNA helicase DinG [Bacillus horti]